MERVRWERLAAMAICAAAGAALLWLGVRVVFSFLMPFLLAWLLSLGLTPLSERVARRLRLPQKLCAVVLLTLTLALLVFLVGASVNRLLRELQALLARLLENGHFPDGVVSGSFDYFERLTSGIGFLERMEAGERYAVFRERFNDLVSELIGSTVSALSAWAPRAAGRLLAALPSVLLFTVVTVIAGFYFCMDRRRIEAACLELLPAGIRRRLPAWRARARHFSWRYIRAYLLLLLLTFAQLFLGLTVLRVEYAFLLAAVIAVVDILPVLGVGTVLVPWAVVELIRKDYRLGVGLLILYLVVTVLRQIIEPRLVGQSLGLHPLLALAAGYAGWRCLGVLGMALGPVLALLAKGAFLLLRRPRAGAEGSGAGEKPEKSD